MLVVEHDEDAIRAADHVIDLGPGAGVHGGACRAGHGRGGGHANPDSLTGRYLARAMKIACRAPPTLADRAPTRSC